MTAQAIEQMPRLMLEQILQRRSERMLYYEDIKLRREGEVCTGGRDVLYTRWVAKPLDEPLTRS